MADELEKQLQDEEVRKVVHQEVARLIAPNWEGKTNVTPPSVDDVANAVVQLAKARAQAHNHKKREMLWNAFWNGFMPEFHGKCIREMLWAKLENLEYPDLVFLAKVLEEGERSTTVLRHSEDIEFAERLEKQRLIYFVDSGDKGADKRTVHRHGLADKMPKFALTEHQFPSTPEPEVPPAT